MLIFVAKVPAEVILMSGNGGINILTASEGWYFMLTLEGNRISLTMQAALRFSWMTGRLKSLEPLAMTGFMMLRQPIMIKLFCGIY